MPNVGEDEKSGERKEALRSERDVKASGYRTELERQKGQASSPTVILVDDVTRNPKPR